MKVSIRTIEAIRLIINGDSDDPKTAAPYRRGTDITEFFSEFRVSPDIGSRWHMTESCLKKINGTSSLKSAIEKTLHPTNYINQGFNLRANIDYLNEFLEYDGYKINFQGKIPKIHKVDSDIYLNSDLPALLSDDLSEWITDHSLKCKTKINTEDYSGAITNARSMLEELFIWILKNTDGGYSDKDEGDITRLANKATKRFDMDPKQVDDPLKQLISGLNSIVAGLAGLRNKASDAHGTNYRPSRRHALLAVEASHAVVNYFVALCKDKKIVDQKALDDYHEALADMHLSDIYFGK